MCGVCVCGLRAFTLCVCVYVSKLHVVVNLVSLCAYVCARLLSVQLPVCIT